MLRCMRTTVSIDDELLRAAKLRAAETGRTLAAVIEDALRLALQERAPAAPRRPIRVPTSGSGGLLPGIGLDDTSSLLERMEGRA
jgi:hypothetical protein